MRRSCYSVYAKMIQHSRFNFTEKKELCVLPVIFFIVLEVALNPRCACILARIKIFVELYAFFGIEDMAYP